MSPRKNPSKAKGTKAKAPTRENNPYQDAVKEAKVNPTPKEAEAAAISAARQNLKQRPPRFAVSMKSKGTNARGEPVIVSGPPHSDHDGWAQRLRDVFASESADFAISNMERIANLVGGQDAASTQTGMNAALASIEAIGPKDELEAQLAVQMATTHALQLEMLQRLRFADTMDKVEKYGTLATKLARTFTAQIEALAKLRRGGEQTVRVEHVHVYPGGKAVVGTVNNHPPQGGRGSSENSDQPHAYADGSSEATRTITYEPRVPLPALLSEDAERLPVSLPNGHG